MEVQNINILKLYHCLEHVIRLSLMDNFWLYILKLCLSNFESYIRVLVDQQVLIIYYLFLQYEDI